MERVLADFNLYVNKYLACDKLQIVRLTEVDLLVGPGNFKPVKSLSLSLPLRSPWMFKILFIHAQSKLPSLSSNLISKSSFLLIWTFFRWKSTKVSLIFLFINVYFYLNIWCLEKLIFCLFQALIWEKDFFIVFSTYLSTVSNPKNITIFEILSYPLRMRFQIPLYRFNSVFFL